MGAKGANYLSGALKVNTSLKELKCAACLLAHDSALPIFNIFLPVLRSCPGHALVIYRYQSYPSGLLHVLDLNLCLCLSLACHSVACHHSFIPRKHTEQSKPHANAQMPYISSATLTKPMPLLGWLGWIPRGVSCPLLLILSSCVEAQRNHPFPSSLLLQARQQGHQR